MTLRVGLLVNPIAGLGGPAALKGSDTAWREALQGGARPSAPERAERFVAAVGDAVAWTTVSGSMGVEAPGATVLDLGALPLGSTTPEDTRRAAVALRDAGVDLLCFVGGDGTATDVAEAVGTSVACLGVPAGVKVTSAVFTHDVEEAAWLVAHLGDRSETVARDVTDLDEEAYRAGLLELRLTGSLRVPLSPAMQGGKVATSVETPLEGLVDMVLRDWDPEALHLVGAGSVCMAVKERFWGTPTLLGLDAIQGDRIRETDLDADGVRRVVAAAQAEGRTVSVHLSVVGGQGMLLGRGTQVLPADVLAAVGWDALRVAAPPEKLLGLRGVWVDTGDPDVDATAPRHIRVVTGWNEMRMVRVLRGGDAPEDSPPAAGA